jgi:hypothetical protein
MTEIDRARVGETTGDARIKALFEAWRRQLVIGDAEGAPENETGRISEIEYEIFDTPAGDVGDAIKLYLLAQNVLYSGPGGILYSPAEPGVDGYDDQGRLNLDYSAFRGLLNNAVRRMPELAPLVADVIAAPSIAGGADNF